MMVMFVLKTAVMNKPVVCIPITLVMIIPTVPKIGVMLNKVANTVKNRSMMEMNVL
jgi:hypothetical protein